MTTTSTSTASGVVNTSGTSTYLTGSASGLDTASLISAAVAQRTAPADALDAKVTANKTKITAYQSLQSLVNALSTSISTLAAPTFTTTASSGNAFQEKSASVTASDGSTAANYLAVSADSTAATTSYTLAVTQLAKAQKVASAAQSTSATLGLTGSFTLQTDKGQATTISVDSSMSLSDIAAAINASSSTSGVSASVIQTTSGTGQLVLSANDTNSPITTSSTSGTDILQTLGMTDASGAFLNTVQPAQPAIATVDGTTVTSDTNQLTNTISGLSIALSQPTPTGVTLDVQVQPNYSDVQTAITGFVTAYNNLRTFITTNQAVGADGSVSSSAVLFADSLLRGVSTAVSNVISQSSPSSASTSTTKSLADLGITLDSSNQMQLASMTTLNNALLNNLSDVSGLFQTQFKTSDSALKLLQNTSPNAYNFTLSVTSDGAGGFTSATVNGESGLFTVSGNRIVGNTGTIYAGLSFALVTNASEDIKVSIQPGVANTVENIAKQYGDPNTGLIQSQINTIGQQDTDYSNSSAQIRSEAATYQATLVTKYSKMETEVSASNLVLAQLNALLNSKTTNG